MIEHSFGPSAPHTIVRHVLENSWRKLTFIHWPYEPDEVQVLLPPGLRIQTFDGKAWVGLVPFEIDVRLPGLPSVPWASRFAETNVRTYVVDKSGRPGVWFFSLDAARLGGVAVARTAFKLPYFWARMSIVEQGDQIHYASQRLWPKPRPADTRVSVAIGEVIQPNELSQIDHFLTSRWTVFSGNERLITYANIWHEPWTLRRAHLLDFEDGLVEAAGLPAPVGEPLVHYSHLAEVHIGRPGLRSK